MPDVDTEVDTIRAVLFDVDGTLYRQRPVRLAMIRRLVAAHWSSPLVGLRVARALSSYRRAQESLRAAGFEGDVATEQLAVAAAGCGLGHGEVAALVTEWMEVAPLDAVAANDRPELVAALDELVARGLQLAAVSDYPARDKLKALGIADRFAVVVSAQDPRVGTFKPNPRGLQVAMDDLGVGPTEALYVGDRSEIDDAAALAAGMRCVLVGGGRRHRNDARFVDVGQLIAIVAGRSSR